MVTAAMKLKDACSLEGKLWHQPRHHIKKQKHYFANKGQSRQRYGFSSSHVCMCELDKKKAKHHRIDATELNWTEPLFIDYVWVVNYII